MNRKHNSTSRAVVDSEEKYRALFNSMAEGFALHELITNAQGIPVDYRFMEVNPAFERLTGKRKEAIIGKTLLDVFPESEKVWIERYGRVALSGVPESFTEYSKETGHWFEVSAYSPVRGQFACIFIDVTNARNLNDQLRESQKMESVGSLAGGVAHGFNNILTVIMGSSAMLQMKLENDHELAPFVRQIVDSSEQAAELTHNLMLFSSNTATNPLPVDLNDIVSGIREFLRQIVGTGITLETHCCRENVIVSVDRGQIEQVLMNLTTNAREAMPAGGVLRLETSRIAIENRMPDPEGCGHGGYVLLKISDCGIGMDAETCSRIFDPFFTTKERASGAGLGLSMAYGIIKQHKGTITVHSEPGIGTEFFICLPLHSGLLSVG